MCGDNPGALEAQSESQTCAAAEKSARGYTALACPACRLLAHLALTQRLKAAVQDLSSAPDREAT
jgi:hypothetical protein